METEVIIRPNVVGSKIRIDLKRSRIYRVNGSEEAEATAITFYQYKIMTFLALNANRVFSRKRIIKEVWPGGVTAGERTIDVHVKRLRENIGDLSGTYIESVHRRGYRVPNIIEEKKVATTEEQRP